MPLESQQPASGGPQPSRAACSSFIPSRGPPQRKDRGGAPTLEESQVARGGSRLSSQRLPLQGRGRESIVQLLGALLHTSDQDVQGITSELTSRPLSRSRPPPPVSHRHRYCIRLDSFCSNADTSLSKHLRAQPCAGGSLKCGCEPCPRGVIIRGSRMQGSTNSHCCLAQAARVPKVMRWCSCLTEAEWRTLVSVLNHSRVVFRCHVWTVPMLACRGRELEEAR